MNEKQITKFPHDFPANRQAALVAFRQIALPAIRTKTAESGSFFEADPPNLDMPTEFAPLSRRMLIISRAEQNGKPFALVDVAIVDYNFDSMRTILLGRAGADRAAT
ncbi:hypothetical protein FJ930_10135 [Mesorhizobium sp. B2-4-15]|uniref:hypothetical protein n=1 Tax=Mesorhizobium sp. B2-4-15 TaxID=2589934 RepID=UPI00114EB728|nr:hypothetical protein [Mesorhizobium sp. B2-4-15]TPK73596.1 hypothetical protein FJ930_10135 [Mesorhizobium sp. B2-4-15]